MYTVANLTSALSGKIRGANLAKVANVNGKIGEAARTMLARIDPETTIRRARIENAIYDRVYNYTAPDDLKGPSKIIDVRPLGERSTADSIAGRYAQEFDIRREYDTLTVETVHGINTLRLSKRLAPHTVLHMCDSLTLGGTVTAGGDVTDLDIDQLSHISGTGAVRFNLSGATGVGTIDFALESAVDLSAMEDIGALFHWLNFPLASALISVQLSWGTNAGNCWSRTATAAHDRAFESAAFQLARYNWSAASKTGTPDAAAVSWLRITLTYTAGTARNGCYLDNITAALGEAWEVLYYSNCLFTNSARTTWKAVPTDPTDLIMADDAAYNILLHETRIILADEIKGKAMARDIEASELILNGTPRRPGLYELYETEHPSQALDQQTTYYDFGTLS